MYRERESGIIYIYIYIHIQSADWPSDATRDSVVRGWLRPCRSAQARPSDDRA